MRVLHFASWHPNVVHPQLGNFVRRHIDAIPPEVESVVLHAWPGISGDLSPSDGLALFSNRKDIPTHFLPVRNAVPRRWRMYKAYNQFCRRLELQGGVPDLIHLHIASEAARAASFWSKRWGVPLLVSEHWTAYHGQNGRDFRPKEERTVREALTKASLHLPVTGHLGRAMAKFAPGVRQKTIPNVVEGCFDHDPSVKPGEGPFRLIHVSSLVDDHKNIQGMLRAVSQVAGQGVDLRLDVFGGAGKGGEELESHQTLARVLGVSSQVHFHGPTSPENVAMSMRNADALVLFSRYENLPCVLLEAWSTGLPVVATDVGGVAEHLGAVPELGTLISSEAEEELTVAVLDFVRRKKEGSMPNPLAIAEYAKARFSQQAVGAEILSAYRSVLE